MYTNVFRGNGNNFVPRVGFVNSDDFNVSPNVVSSIKGEVDKSRSERS